MNKEEIKEFDSKDFEDRSALDYFFDSFIEKTSIRIRFNSNDCTATQSGMFKTFKKELGKFINQSNEESYEDGKKDVREEFYNNGEE